MNFVLDFFVDKQSHPFDIKEMRLLFASSLYFYEKLQSHKSPTWRIAREFVFDDGNTGVHFTLRYNRPEKFDLTVGKFSFSGLCLEMELPKPSFFGYEAMKVVAEVMKSLNLLAACSSHMSDTPEPPQRFSYDELVALWLKANAQEVLDETEKQDELLYADRNKMLYWWRYTSERFRLQLKMKESNVEVPEITFYCRKNGNEAATVCEWIGMKKSVIPVVDYVVIDRKSRPASRRLQRSGPRTSSRLTVGTKNPARGMAPFGEIIKALKGSYEQVDKPLPYIVFSKGLITVQMKRRLMDIDLIPASQFDLVGPDEIVDVRPEAHNNAAKNVS